MRPSSRKPQIQILRHRRLTQVADLYCGRPLAHAMSTETIGIDHIYITVSDLTRSERFYDCVMGILGFRKNTFTNEGDHHI